MTDDNSLNSNSISPLFDIIDAGEGRIIKAWKHGVPFEDKAINQLKNAAKLPFIYRYLAAMPDTHWGMGATVGSVMPTRGAIVPAAVGVDIGCGMIAARTGFKREQFTDLAVIRARIESAIPHGRTDNGGENDIGAWPVNRIPEVYLGCWQTHFQAGYEALCRSYPSARSQNTARHLGTLGTGNHFIELSSDENEDVWIVLHSGSRGMGNRIGTFFTKLVKELCAKWFIDLPDPDLAYLPQGTNEFDDYMNALYLAQEFAWHNRVFMLRAADLALREHFSAGENTDLSSDAVHCHHNYTAQENHFGQNIWVTRKGAVRARLGDMGIIPGSMGARSYIVRGLGSPHSFCSCSHGAGRAMGREEAKRRFSVEDHVKATEGVECHKGPGVIDETPGAYKNIDRVMEAQSDLVEIVHTLKQFVCVKGLEDPSRKR